MTATIEELDLSGIDQDPPPCSVQWTECYCPERVCPCPRVSCGKPSAYRVRISCLCCHAFSIDFLCQPCMTTMTNGDMICTKCGARIEKWEVI